jgi:membrane protein
MVKPSFSRLIKILSGVHEDAEIELSRLERFAHFWVLVGQSFVRNRCPVRAAALSYSALLALIPLLAVAISVTSSLLKSQGEEKIYAAIDRMVQNFVPPATNSVPATESTEDLTDDTVPTNHSSAAQANTPVVSVGAQKATAKWIHEFVQNTRSGTLGALGMLLLVFVAIQMLASIESTFNDIWGVARGRNWIWRIILYWTTITLGPLLIAAALGLAGGPHFQTTKDIVAQMPFIGSLIFKLLPLAVLWLAFTLIYMLVPNTKVNYSAALVGGVVGGTLWHLNNLFGFLYVSRVISNSAIYGKLGLLPVFMAGIYLSWLILLFGAQVSYAFQNRKLYMQEKLVENVNQRGREFIALRLMTFIAQKFQRGEPPATLSQISAQICIPTKLVQQVLRPLQAARLVTELAGAEPAYLPTRPLEDITAHNILRAIRAAPGTDIATRDEPARAEVLGEFAKIEQAERDAASRVTLLTLANRAQKQIEDAGTKS